MDKLPMSYEEIDAADVQTAVQGIARYLEDMGNAAPKYIYFNGWDHGLAASAVLRAIAEHPPPSVLEKFDKIIHVDCSRWKSRRALQKAIADELNLTQQVVADFDWQEEEDDFSGLDQGSRAEIENVTRVIARSLAQYRCLVVFHNGSGNKVDLTSCGIPPPGLFSTKVLWTFTGRLRLINKIWSKAEQAGAHLCLIVHDSAANWNALLAEEAREIALYTHKLGFGVIPEIALECCLYLLSLNHRGGDVIDYNWETHASSYWVCDGIVEGGQDNQAWELARALQQQIRLEAYSSNREPEYFGSELDISAKHWISITGSNSKEISPGTTSLFFAPRRRHVSPLPSELFHEADQLRVLKLCRSTFSFSSPPFHCCRNLRFLGLDRCTDEQQPGEEEKQTGGALAVETFKRLWVLDVSHTDWELDFPLETQEPVVATDIREVHINNGRIWRSNLAWRRLPNLRQLRVVEPTRSWWETGREDEFVDTVKLELLDLTKNSTMQVLPSLSGATNIKTLVLDGCVGLEHVGPQGLPPSLESFSLDVGADGDHKKNAKISRISLAGCARLADFRLRGSLPNLKELDLSHTAVKMLDLRDYVAVQCLQNVFLVGCEQLRSISWPKFKEMQQLRLLCIDTRAGEVGDSLMGRHGEGEEYCHALIVIVADMRFLQSLDFPWVAGPMVKLNLCFSSSITDDGRSCHEEGMARPYSSSGRLDASGSPLPKPLPYRDISTEQQIIAQIDGSSTATTPFQPRDIHMEVGEGIRDFTNTVSKEGRQKIWSVLSTAQSLHVHDSSSITTVTPEDIFLSRENTWEIMDSLMWCRVERCAKLDTVFASDYNRSTFSKLETFWAARLLMARSIWRRPTTPNKGYYMYRSSFALLRVIHLHFCPRLRYVLALSSNYALSNNLETLHILCCGDLRQVFPVEKEFLNAIVASHDGPWTWKSMEGMLVFPKLRDLYLHDLPSLQLICEAKMFAPNLETIRLRGCWGLRRLPATDGRRREDGRPVAVDCEKDWWDKLEWDGMEHGHHPSLFQPRHSKYYKKRHLRRTVLR